jgi:DNA polymerase
VTELPVFEDLAAVATAVNTCERCRLARGRTNAVPGEGNSEAALMFIGEGPGYHEDQQGRPFVGQAGNLLDELIGGIGMQRSDVYIANIIKCRPPNNRDPQTDEVEACRPYLQRQVELIKPRLIVLLGRYALNEFFPDARISKAHGVPRRLDGRSYLPVYHPAAALRQSRLREVLNDDFQLIPKLLADPALAAPKPTKDPAVQQLSLFS